MGGSKIHKSANFNHIIGKSATFAKLAIENENLNIPFKIRIYKNVCYSLLCLDLFTEMP